MKQIIKKMVYLSIVKNVVLLSWYLFQQVYNCQYLSKQLQCVGILLLVYITMTERRMPTIN